MPAATYDTVSSGLDSIASALVAEGLLPRPPAGHQTPRPTPSQPTSLNPTVPDFPELAGKDVSQQLDTLANLLEVENRIKDGAENLLEARPKENLRRQVESELAAAKSKIAAITQKMEMLRESSGLARGLRKKPQGGPSLTSNGSTKRTIFSGNINGKTLKDESIDKDDFKTALGQAKACIRTLSTYPRQFPPSPLQSTITPAPAPSSSSAIFQPPTPTSATELDSARTDTMIKLALILQRNMRTRFELDITEIISAVVPALADSASKESRAAAYRLLRYAMVDGDAAEKLQEHNLDWYIIRSLSRDNKHATEKEQVVLLVRSLIDIGSQRRPASAGPGSGTVPLSEPVMRALIALAEHGEDPFRLLCLETLAEILLIDIDLTFRTGGIRVLLQALVDGPPELGPSLAMTFLYIVDAPRTRAYLTPGTELEIALSGITDAYGKSDANSDRMRACSRIISAMLRTWSGLMYLCMEDMLSIRTLVDTLRIPSLETREIILDMFSEVLNIKTPGWYKPFLDGKRLTMYGRQKPVPGQPEDPDGSYRTTEKLTLVDQYIALLLMVLTEAGLLDALMSMLEESGSGTMLTRKATLLIGEILQISNRVLPLNIAARMQALPRIFDLAADYKTEENRIVGISALSAIDSFNRNRARLQPSPASTRMRANSVEDPIRRGQRQVEQVKIKMGMQIDDRAFQNLLLETQVMLTKDYTKWNFEVLMDLIEGPLLNPKRLEEAIKVSKFGKRLMSFFHPFAHRFSDIKKNKANLRYIRLGCTLLTTLVASPDGRRFLSTEDPFLRQITECFAQLDPFNGTPSSDPIFSKARVEETLTSGYLEMLGTLSKYPEGIELMEQFKVFTAFYHLSELRSREDLIKGIIENIDYAIDGHPRIVLSKALTSSYKHIRLYATQHLGQLIQNSAKANSWTLRLLLTQLYDPAMEVCEMAVNFLEDACEARDILQLVVEMQPTLDHLGDLGHPLLLKFMSTPVGFRYLYQTEYIEREMNTWFNERNYQYVVHVEVYLTKAFLNQVEDDEDILTFDGTVPPHFYGEMSKTELGCQILHEKAHISDFCNFIRQHGLESDDFEIILKLKSVLWAIGNIGATEGGLPFLEEEEIIPTVLEIAEQSLVLSVRGTCFFVLGLVSMTTQGAEILSDYDWAATTTPLGDTTGMCIPLDLAKFVSIPPWQFPTTGRTPSTSASSPSGDNLPLAAGPPSDRRLSPSCFTPPNRLPPLTRPVENDVIRAIQNLANTVIANAASRTLARVKARSDNRTVFSSIPLFYHTLHILSTQHYRLPVRRYILDLFDIKLDPVVVAALTNYAREAEEYARQLDIDGHLVQKKNQPQVDPNLTTGRKDKRKSRHKRDSNSDGEDDLGVIWSQSEDSKQEDVLSVKMRPLNRMVGFDVTDSD